MLIFINSLPLLKTIGRTRLSVGLRTQSRVLAGETGHKNSVKQGKGVKMKK